MLLTWNSLWIDYQREHHAHRYKELNLMVVEGLAPCDLFAVLEVLAKDREGEAAMQTILSFWTRKHICMCASSIFFDD